MTLEEIRALVADEFTATDARIESSLGSDVVLVNQLGHYIVNSGGKRLRPLVVLLSAGALGGKIEQAPSLAAIIELIHTATLLHDDVVDASDLRRGRKTANALFGNEASVLVGDFIYSRCFQMMVGLGDMRVMDILAETTNRVAAGEVLQLMNCHDPDTSVEAYYQVIRDKTAILFSAATRLPAVAGGCEQDLEQALADYGMHLGIAFQLIDDLLDYDSDADTLGKNIGDDLAEGKPTLPLILAMEKGSTAQRDMIRQAIREGGLEHMDEIVSTVRSTGALTATREAARLEIDNALNALKALPASVYRDALQAVATSSLQRLS